MGRNWVILPMGTLVIAKEGTQEYIISQSRNHLLKESLILDLRQLHIKPILQRSKKPKSRVPACPLPNFTAYKWDAMGPLLNTCDQDIILGEPK